MKPLAIYLLEVLACNGLLLGAYAILLDRHCRYDWCRRYLLLIPLLSVAIPLLKIPVWAAKEVVGRVEVLPQEIQATIVQTPTPTLSVTELIIIGYLFGIVLFVGLLAVQLRAIHRLRRDAKITHTERYTLVATHRHIASFSFLHAIYVWEQTPKEMMPAILAHEASHIARHHSLERLAMEGMKVLLWWNPFVWIGERMLTEVQEYEADSDVLKGGYNLREYMDTLFRQMFGYSPDIANNLRDSLTKKRLKMMTKHLNGRHTLLRLAATLPAIIALLCAFSFTTRAATTPSNEIQEGDKSLSTANDQPATQQRGQDETLLKQETPLHNIDGVEQNLSNESQLNTAQTKTADLLNEPTVTAKYDEHGANRAAIVTTKEADKPVETKETPYLIAEQMPLFDGGDLNVFLQWVGTQIKYPKEALANKVQGRVLVSFVIRENSQLDDIRLVKPADKALSEEAIRVIKSSAGHWTAGKQKGKAVAVKYTIPVKFELPAENK